MDELHPPDPDLHQIYEILIPRSPPPSPGPDPQDLLQDVWLRLLKSKVKGGRLNLPAGVQAAKAYLLRAMINQQASLHRARAPQTSISEAGDQKMVDGSDSTMGAIFIAELRSRIRDGLGRLTLAQRTALEMVLIHGETYADAARSIRTFDAPCSTHRVKALIKKAKSDLAWHLRGYSLG